MHCVLQHCCQAHQRLKERDRKAESACAGLGVYAMHSPPQPPPPEPHTLCGEPGPMQGALEAAGQLPASLAASTELPGQSMAMRVAAIVQGSQSGTLDELWTLFCGLQACSGSTTDPISPAIIISQFALSASG